MKTKTILKLIAVAAVFILMAPSCKNDDSQLKLVNSTHGSRQELIGIIPGIDYLNQLGDGEYIELSDEQLSILLALKGYKNSRPFENTPLQLVDHEQFSIVFGSAVTNSGVASLEQNFIKEAFASYKYNVIVYCDITAVVEGVSYGVVTNKIPEAADIEFNIDIKY